MGSNSSADLPGATGSPATPGINGGAQSRFPGDASGSSGSRDSATGDLNSGDSGNPNSSYDVLGGPSGNYSLDNLPGSSRSGDQAGTAGNQPGQPGASGTPTGAITSAERTGQLDDALRRGYEEFDGFILGERERAQAESNAAGSSPIGDQGQQSGGGAGNAAQQPQTLPGESGSPPSGVAAASPQVASAPRQNETFPPPDDIPSGRDDDVVARQIREAAMSEPDPELREALWEEYRNYTGLGGNN